MLKDVGRNFLYENQLLQIKFCSQNAEEFFFGQLRKFEYVLLQNNVIGVVFVLEDVLILKSS